jgi:pSer/pThr/pTyr-binding forkhead associated (FHA) protein/predicted  nucleic acid-binding Zn-ribbon protein
MRGEKTHDERGPRLAVCGSVCKLAVTVVCSYQSGFCCYGLCTNTRFSGVEGAYVLELVFRDHSDTSRVVPLESGKVVTVGRSSDSTVYIKNPSVSRHHARLLDEAGVWCVEDLGSSNHTFVNDEQVQKADVSMGDALRFGDFQVQVRARKQTDSGAGKEVAPKQGQRTKPARKDKSASQKPLRTVRRSPESPLKVQDLDELPPDKASASRPAQPSRPERASKDGKRTEKPTRPRRASSSRESSSTIPKPRATDSGTSQDAEARKKAEEEIAELQLELHKATARVEELESRCKELEQREDRHEEELDAWHERYNRVREQLDHKDLLLEQARGDAEEKNQEVEKLEAQVVELEGEASAVEAARNETGQMTSDLKTRLVQKDRRIDDLQRELDLMEYDLRSGREELEALQDSFNHDSGEQRRLERETELLRDVIAEKENVIAELKIEIEDKSREVYDLKLGTGIKDLEEARRDVLEQFFEKNREADKLVADLKDRERQLEESQKQLQDMEERLSEQRDVTNHPDFERKERELERVAQDLQTAHEDSERLEKRLEEFGPEEKAKQEAEINFLERKNRALQDKIAAAEGDEAAPVVSSEAAGAASSVVATEETGNIESHAEVRELITEGAEKALELYAEIKSSQTLMKTYVEEAEAAVAADGEVADAFDSIKDLLRVLNSDTRALRGELGKLQRVFGEED